MIHVLPNGLRVVHVMRQSPVTWCGIAVGAGCRDEEPGQYGLAHFVEHTIFKGTTHRRSCHIINRMERVGGELNAYTSREETLIYSIFPSQHLSRAVELLADLVQNATFPPNELERELEVVLEEVASYRDTPADAAYDDVEDLIFAGSDMGHSVLGNEAHLKTLTSDDCRRFVERHYSPENMVFFSAGSERPERVFRLVEKYFGSLRRPCQPHQRVLPAVNAPVRREVEIGSHQAHTVIASRVPGMRSDQRYALALLCNILGGPGMNSLLNVQLREKRGYVYSVEANLSLFSDCGLAEIYMGCDHRDLKASLGVVDRVTRQLAEMPFSERRLDAFKRQYCGQLLVTSDNAENQAMNAGKSVLYDNRLTSLHDTVEMIQAVTPEQLRQAAELLTLDRATVLTLK